MSDEIPNDEPEIYTPAEKLLLKKGIELKEADFLKLITLSDLTYSMISVRVYNSFKDGPFYSMSQGIFPSTPPHKESLEGPPIQEYNAYALLNIHSGKLIDYKKTGKNTVRDAKNQLASCNISFYDELETQSASQIRDTFQKCREYFGIPQYAEEKIDLGGEPAHIDAFVLKTIAPKIKDKQDVFLSPLADLSQDQLHKDSMLRRLAGKADAQGNRLDLVAEVVMAGEQNLVEQYGMNRGDIAHVDADLQSLGFGLYMRDDAIKAYETDVQERIDEITGKNRIAEKQQLFKTKLGL